MTQIFMLIALLAHVGAAVRLLAYRKDGARHRRHVSWIAWALLVVLGGSALELLLQRHPVGFFEAARAVLFSLFIFGTRGNVARLLRSE